jgi:hypothetical protein
LRAAAGGKAGLGSRWHRSRLDLRVRPG